MRPRFSYSGLDTSGLVLGLELRADQARVIDKLFGESSDTAARCPAQPPFSALVLFVQTLSLCRLFLHPFSFPASSVSLLSWTPSLPFFTCHLLAPLMS